MKKLYCFYDEKALFFHSPFVADTVASVARSLNGMRQDASDAPFIRYPEDFVLYEIGEFDELVGMIAGRSPPERLGNVASMLAQFDT